MEQILAHFIPETHEQYLKLIEVLELLTDEYGVCLCYETYEANDLIPDIMKEENYD